MSYPFVQAKYDYGPRTAPVRAFVVHMAEGGGTVGYLAGSPARGVSVHYVIEYSGRIVQMLAEGHASGSINPQEIRTGDDADGFYGVTAAKSVMGPDWSNPNAAVISVEIEGFASQGPRAAQALSLIELVDDVRSRHPGIGLLGHRDFASYKACPGTHIAWDDLGGHGAMGLHVTFPPGPIVTGMLHIPVGTDSIRVATGTHYLTLAAADRPAVKIALTGGNSGSGYLVDLNGDENHVVRASTKAVFTPSPPPVVSCDDVVTQELSKAADRAAQAVRSRP